MSVSEDRQRQRSIVDGHSIRGSVVFNNHGERWGTFETHSEAVTAVEMYRIGFAHGKRGGLREGAKKARDDMRSALGLD